MSFKLRQYFLVILHILLLTHYFIVTPKLMVSLVVLFRKPPKEMEVQYDGLSYEGEQEIEKQFYEDGQSWLYL